MFSGFDDTSQKKKKKIRKKGRKRYKIIEKLINGLFEVKDPAKRKPMIDPETENPIIKECHSICIDFKKMDIKNTINMY